MAANDPPVLFSEDGVVFRLENSASPPVLAPVTEDRLRYELARATRWTTPSKDGVLRLALPPIHVVKDMLANPCPPLPRAPRIIGAPTFSAHGGLIAAPGYDAADSVYYAPAPGLIIPPIPEAPQGSDIARAKGAFDELLCDFPFSGDAERAHALAFLLLPFLRDLIDGATPLHLFDKPSPGTGASLLVETLAMVAMGQPPPVMVAGRDDEEWRKRITAKLLSGAPVVFIDNVVRRLDAAALSAAITSKVWEDRLLGATRMIRVRVRCAWVATANNARLSHELARRTVRCRLDAKVDRPFDRRGFRHRLPEWAEQNRGELIWAAMVVIRAWLARGRPGGHAVLGGFESWSHVVSGVLRVVGVSDFLGNMREVYELSDEEGAEDRRLLAAWWEKYGPAEVGVTELFDLATSDEVGVDLSSKSERGQRTQLGHRVASMRDRRYTLTIAEGENRGEITVRVNPAGTLQRAGRWKLALDAEQGSLSSPRPETEERVRASAMNLPGEPHADVYQSSPGPPAPRHTDSGDLGRESRDPAAQQGEPSELCEPVPGSDPRGSSSWPDEVDVHGTDPRRPAEALPDWVTEDDQGNGEEATGAQE